jgi:glyoxylase-like metal-dependent hydrolase (beta-lactamase superfamily II)
MSQISEGVYFFKGQDDMIPDAHVYVIGKSESGDLSMIDAGLMGKASHKIKDIQALGIRLGDIKRIIMTHTHLDHIGCLSEMREKMPWAELWVHSLEAGPLEQGDERTVYGMDMFKNMCQMQYGLKKGMFTFQVDRKLEGGELLTIGDMEWEVIHIPGHSAGSIALYNPMEAILIPGDVVYADYAIGRFDLHGADPQRHRDSLTRLGELHVKILLPGHNRIMKEVPQGYILKTAEQWGPYLA